MNNKNITAYIDASNLRFDIRDDGWELDYKSFRSWLRDKFGITRAVLFMGLIPANIKLYNFLQNIGYDIIFRPTLTSKDGKTKWNVDTEITLHMVSDFYENRITSAVLVSGDGDFYSVVDFFKNKKMPIKVIAPNSKFLSYLLKQTNVPIIYLNDFSHKIGKK